jgi:hypothetical protein
MAHAIEVTCAAVVPRPSATRRFAVRLCIAVLALALLVPADGLGSAGPAAKPSSAGKVELAKKKKRRRHRCRRYRRVRVKRHGHFVKRHGRYLTVRRCVKANKKKTTPTAPAPAPRGAPPAPPGFTVGMVSGPSPVWEAGLFPSLHPRLVRFEVSIDTKASDLAQYVGGMAARGTEVIPMASFYGRIPSVSEAQNLAGWAHAYGPGGTFWKGRSDGAFAMRHIEFGNETNDSYQFGCGPGCSGYKSRAGQYALRVKDAADAIAGPNGNPNVSILAQGDDGNCNCSDWVDGMFSAVPDLNKRVGGWTAHPYGPKTRYGPILNQLMKDTAKHGDTTLPVFITEYGISTDNGRCVNKNYEWPLCMTYAQAAAAMHASIADIHATYPRVRALMIFVQRDQATSGSSSGYEGYFGAFQKNGAPKGAYSAEVVSEVNTYRG